MPPPGRPKRRSGWLRCVPCYCRHRLRRRTRPLSERSQAGSRARSICSPGHGCRQPSGRPVSSNARDTASHRSRRHDQFDGTARPAQELGYVQRGDRSSDRLIPSRGSRAMHTTAPARYRQRRPVCGAHNQPPPPQLGRSIALCIVIAALIPISDAENARFFALFAIDGRDGTVIQLIPTGGLVDSYGFAGNWPEMAGTSPAMTGMERSSNSPVGISTLIRRMVPLVVDAVLGRNELEGAMSTLACDPKKEMSGRDA